MVQLDEMFSDLVFQLKFQQGHWYSFSMEDILSLNLHKFCSLANGSLIVDRGRYLLRAVGTHKAQDSEVPRTEADLRQLCMKIGIQGAACDTMLWKARLNMVATPDRTRSTTDIIVLDDDEPSICPSSCKSARSSTLCKRSAQPLVINDVAKHMRFPSGAAYKAMALDDPDKLIAEVQQRDALLKQYRVILRQEGLLGSAVAKRHTPEPSPNAGWELVRKRSTTDIVNYSHLTTRARMAASVRVNISSVAAKHFGSATLNDISGNTVCRCERQAGAALISCARSFNADARRAQYSCHAFSSDATNSSVWQNAKLQGLYLQTSLVMFESPGVPSIESHQSWSDVQRVDHGCTGGTLALVRKQLECLGCTAWLAAPGPDRAPSESDLQAIKLWLYTCDGGPDQQGFCRVLLHDTEGLPNALVVTIYCIMHASQVVLKHGLAALDSLTLKLPTPFRMFSVLAKLTLTWRESARKVFLTWGELFGFSAAHVNGKRIPPRCIAGRWSSMYNTIRFLKDRDSDQLVAVLRAVFGKYKTGDDHAIVQIDDADVSELITQEERRVKVGKWRRQVLEVITTTMFWNCVDVTFHSLGHTEHIMAWLKKQQDIEVDGSHVAQLVYGKATTFLHEMADAFSRPQNWTTLRRGTSDADRPAVIAMGVLLFAHDIAAYSRKFEPFFRLPLTIVWFAYRPHDVFCQKRVDLAKELLGHDIHKLDITSRKFVRICKSELEDTVTSGLAGERTYAMALLMRNNLLPDAQRNVQYNSLISTISKRCRHIGLPLLCARANMKKTLGVGTRGAAHKWSHIRAACSGVLDDLERHVPLSQDILNDSSRWSCPAPMHVPLKDELDRVAKRMCTTSGIISDGDSIRWAAKFAPQFK